MKDSIIKMEKIDGDYKFFRVLLGIAFVLIITITFIFYYQNIKQLASLLFSAAEAFIRHYLPISL
jgi:hypothetical protein